MKIVRTVAELRDALADAPRPVGFAPTMGFLHAGHQRLFRRSASECATTVASVFVNPTQFNDPDDLLSYPRDAEGDTKRAAQAGVDILWMPAESDIYPAGNATTVSVSGLTDRLCGASRPGHFDGVATVVARLLAAVLPDNAYFGEKDFQQLAVIRRLVADLLLPVTIVGVPTVREPDGLALSSRNSRLSLEQRAAALAISTGLKALQDEWEQGVRSAGSLRKALTEAIDTNPLLTIDYAEIVDAATLEPSGEILTDNRAWLAAVAVFCGEVRLIDNCVVEAA
jgi:pantoate--beta-alanine ligase